MVADIPKAVGFVIPEAEVQIVDADGKILPPGSEGAVRLRTTQFLENFAITDSDTWYYTGDIGWLTKNGVLCIAGRDGDVLNRGGVKLSISDFEEFFRSRPGVLDAGISTLMGSSGFEEVWVGLVLSSSADLDGLRNSIDTSGNYSRNFDRLFAVEAIPRGALGKIQRDALRTMLMELDADVSDGAAGKTVV